jgi:pimeloyl-ACP methyl ester carboxylesterase
MFFLASCGFRCIAHDRRGHGRSSQPWNGNDMDTYADDLAALVNELDLKDVVHVGHSTGGRAANSVSLKIGGLARLIRGFSIVERGFSGAAPTFKPYPNKLERAAR